MRLIIIEDDEVFGLHLKQLLEMNRHRVDWLPNAETALSRVTLHHQEYDLIILDFKLSGMNGMEFTQELRTNAIYTPIIMLTGNGEVKNMVSLLNAGADDYIVKPFLIDELIARINSVLRRPTVAQPISYSIGNITIDTAKRKVHVQDEEIVLTLKEYALLECFVRRPGEVLTREELSDKVWDFSSMTMSNVLDVHIKNLRKKMYAANKSEYFETIRGVGYRLLV